MWFSNLDGEEILAPIVSAKPLELIAVSAAPRSVVIEHFQDLAQVSATQRSESSKYYESWYNVMLLIWRDGLAERHGMASSHKRSLLRKAYRLALSGRKVSWARTHIKVYSRSCHAVKSQSITKLRVIRP